MPVTKIHELLPVPEGPQPPHPYQVFGLQGGEQNLKTIAIAIKKTVAKLESAKPEVAPEIWKQAALMVKQSRSILLDPEKKRKLDVRFGIVDFDSLAVQPFPVPPPTEKQSSPTTMTKPEATVSQVSKSELQNIDPLAAFLPDGDPLVPYHRIATVTQGATSRKPDPLRNFNSAVMNQTNPAPPPEELPQSWADSWIDPDVSCDPSPGIASVFTTPSSTTPTFTTPTSARQSALAVSVRNRKATSRRRKSSIGFYLFSLFMVAMLATVAGLFWFVVWNQGTLSVAGSNNGISINVNSPENSRRVDPNRERRVARSSDRVLGNLASPPSNRNRPSNFLGNDLDSNDSMNPSAASVDTATVAATKDEDEDASTPLSMPAEQPDAISPPNDATAERLTETKPVITPELLAASEERIAAAQKAILERNWDQMKSLAEQATASALSEPQKSRSASLYQIADLASFYRGGIDRGLATLSGGNDFQLTDAIRVNVVEASPNQLILRVNGSNKIYARNDFPPILEEKLAKFAMDKDQPITFAAKAAYQAIAAKSTAEHRLQAIRWLEEMSEPVEDVDPAQMAATLRELLELPN